MQRPNPECVLSQKYIKIQAQYKQRIGDYFMDIHSRRRERNGAEERKKFSLKAHGISSYHAAPAALMVVAGLALSAVISDVPPSFNQAFT